MDCGFKFKMQNFKTFIRKHRRKSLGSKPT